MLHNLYFFVLIFILQNTIGLGLALLLNSRLPGHQIHRTVLYIPAILSLVVTGFIWELMLSPQIGLVNPTLKNMGLGGLQQVWLGDPSISLPVVILVQAWQWMGVPMVVYSAAWTDANMGRFFLNSVVVTLGGVVINLLCSTPLAYALARFRFRLNGFLFIFIVGGLIAPGQLIGISLLQWVKTLHLFNTYFSLIFPYAAFGMPVAVLILSGFFRQLPRELEEAALIDGAGEFTAFLRIMVPLVRPALATVIIFNGIGIWNDFFLPLVLAYTPDIQTLPLGIILLFGAFSSEWGTIFAAVIIASVPVIIAYFFLTRQFIAGLSAGAVKG